MLRSKFLMGCLLVLVVAVILTGVVGTAALAAPRLASVVTGLAAARPAPVALAPQAAATALPVSTRTLTAATTSAAPVISIQPGADSESAILEAVYQKVNPSVVMITNLAAGGLRSGSGAIPQGEGSGFVWDNQGHIVTNDHVVAGSDALQVTFADGTVVEGKLVGADPGGDIAVVKVDPILVSLTPVEQGNMTDVKVGQMAIAIGNPFGFEGTMTRGIVSALGRTIPSQNSFDIPSAIQTDAAINPGNSGGPLLNAEGQVIGVNDQIQSQSGSNSGVGFAIPISIVQRIVPALVEKGSYAHPYLGIQGATYTRAWSEALGLPADANGAYVMSVVRGGPAQRAGLRSGAQDTNVVLGQDRTGMVYLQKGGDLITAIDGEKITKMDDLLVYLSEHGTPGQKVQLTILRDGREQTVSVTLGERPANASE